jgi:hypothetical protein
MSRKIEKHFHRSQLEGEVCKQRFFESTKTSKLSEKPYKSLQNEGH